jgi:hypothetical protein
MHPYSQKGKGNWIFKHLMFESTSPSSSSSSSSSSNTSSSSNSNDNNNNNNTGDGGGGGGGTSGGNIGGVNNAISSSGGSNSSGASGSGGSNTSRIPSIQASVLTTTDVQNPNSPVGGQFTHWRITTNSPFIPSNRQQRFVPTTSTAPGEGNLIPGNNRQHRARQLQYSNVDCDTQSANNPSFSKEQTKPQLKMPIGNRIQTVDKPSGTTQISDGRYMLTQDRNISISSNTVAISGSEPQDYSSQTLSTSNETIYDLMYEQLQRSMIRLLGSSYVPPNYPSLREIGSRTISQQNRKKITIQQLLS